MPKYDIEYESRTWYVTKDGRRLQETYRTMKAAESAAHELWDKAFTAKLARKLRGWK